MSEIKDIKTDQVKNKLLELFDDVLTHDGFGEIKIEMKIEMKQE